LTGYMIVSMGLLLGYLAAVMFQVFLERYTIYLDKITFTFIMYNFAIVGVISIFLGGPGSKIRIVPVYMNQIYLVLTSVIVAWQLSHFDPWTAWVLLVLLAFYDLFAVLTPCGPLKALVNLMHRENAPAMPGLLYEASLPNSNNNSTTSNNRSRNRSRRSQQQQQQSTASNTAAMNGHADDTSPMVQSDHQLPNGSSYNSIPPPNTSNFTRGTTLEQPTVAVSTSNQTNLIAPQTTESPLNNNDSRNGEIESEAARGNTVYDVDTGEASSSLYYTNDSNEAIEVSQPLIHNTAFIPFALAKLYKLPFRYDPQPPWITERRSLNNQPQHGTSATVSNAPTTTGTENIVYTPAQLHQLVEVVFPHGGRIVPTISLDTPVAELYRQTQLRDQYQTRYTVIDAHGVHKRVLFVNEIDGRVFEDLREENMLNERRERVRNSIKLGLGDFIFYSILVSKAALYSYTTFAVCTLAVLSGLGMTLLLLAMYGQALPALPISILLGVLFFILTRYVIEPWIEAMYIARVYV
jgi:Presenilin